MIGLARVSGLFVVALVFGLCPVVAVGETIDPFMGDWEGSGSASDGESFDFAAQVIGLGDGKYRINILQEFDTPTEPMHVMDGVLKDGKFPYTSDGGAYTGNGTLDGDVFKGFYKGDVDGRYEMKRVVRLSPTLGTRGRTGARREAFPGRSRDAPRHPPIPLSRRVSGRRRAAPTSARTARARRRASRPAGGTRRP